MSDVLVHPAHRFRRTTSEPRWLLGSGRLEALEQPLAELLSLHQLMAKCLHFRSRNFSLERRQIFLQELAEHSRLILREIESHELAHLAV
jgi:hypothetical protein